LTDSWAAEGYGFSSWNYNQDVHASLNGTNLLPWVDSNQCFYSKDKEELSKIRWAGYTNWQNQAVQDLSWPRGPWLNHKQPLGGN